MNTTKAYNKTVAYQAILIKADLEADRINIPTARYAYKRLRSIVTASNNKELREHMDKTEAYVFLSNL